VNDVTRREYRLDVGCCGRVVGDDRHVRYSCRASRESELLGEVPAHGHNQVDAVLGGQAAHGLVRFHCSSRAGALVGLLRALPRCC
jgi:hypothetical protein